MFIYKMVDYFEIYYENRIELQYDESYYAKEQDSDEFSLAIYVKKNIYIYIKLYK